MRTFIFLMLFSLFLIVSSDKNKKSKKFLKTFHFHKNYHPLRNLEASDNILIGFGKYLQNNIDNYIEFYTKIKFPYKENITDKISIPVNISYFSPKKVESKNVECTKTEPIDDSYCTYRCRETVQNNNISSVKFNYKDNKYILTSLTNATKDISSQESNKFMDIKNISILDNANIFRKSGRHFVIKGELDSDYESDNIKLIISKNNVRRDLSCKGYVDSINLIAYYFLDCDTSDSSLNIDLQNSFAYLEGDKQKGIIINFDQSNNSTLRTSDYYTNKKKSSGLSTGGIIAIVIPCIILLLLIVGLAYFLNRRAPTPPLKELVNTSNTVGPAGASSEAVVNQ